MLEAGARFGRAKIPPFSTARSLTLRARAAVTALWPRRRVWHGCVPRASPRRKISRLPVWDAIRIVLPQPKWESRKSCGGGAPAGAVVDQFRVRRELIG